MPEYTQDEKIKYLQSSIRALPVLLSHLSDIATEMLCDLLQATLETGYADGFQDGQRSMKSQADEDSE